MPSSDDAPSQKVDAKQLAALVAAVALVGGAFALFNGVPWVPKAQVEREIAQLESSMRQLRGELYDVARRLEEHNRAQDTAIEKNRERADFDRERIVNLEHRLPPRTYDTRPR